MVDVATASGRPLGEVLTLRVAAGPPESRRVKVAAASGAAGWRVDVDGRQVVVGRDGSQQVLRVPEAVTAGSRTVMESASRSGLTELTFGGRLQQIGTGADLRLRLDPVRSPAAR